MIRKPIPWPSSHQVLAPTLDRTTAERVTQWVTRWHAADYEAGEITEMLAGWPSNVRLDELMKPFNTVSESASGAALARLVLELVRLVERGTLQTTPARGAFRSACSRLCVRGIPFEETAKGDEAALWFHFIASTEFGDPDTTGYATDLSELRLLARLFLDREQLGEVLLSGEFPPTFDEGYVNVAASLGDRRFVPLLLRVLSRCEDAQATATTVAAIGQLYRKAREDNLVQSSDPDAVADSYVAEALAGYARSANVEVATATVLALEAIGGPQAARTLREVEGLLAERDTMLGAHVRFALLHLAHGERRLDEMLIATARDRETPTPWRLCAVERLSGACFREAITALAELLDDPTIERVRMDGYLTDDVVYVLREATFMALMECPIRYLVEVLGEGILTRLDTFEMYSLPSWWPARQTGDEQSEPTGEL